MILSDLVLVKPFLSFGITSIQLIPPFPPGQINIPICFVKLENGSNEDVIANEEFIIDPETVDIMWIEHPQWSDYGQTRRERLVNSFLHIRQHFGLPYNVQVRGNIHNLLIIIGREVRVLDHWEKMC